MADVPGFERFTVVEPPGGKCSYRNCLQDAVVEIAVTLTDVDGLRQLKLCDEHRQHVALILLAHTGDGDAVIGEGVEVEFEGKRFRVEDGRLIREDPNG